MAESIPVRCPGCRREHRYTAPAYPCACGAPVSPPLDPLGTATTVTHRTWDEDWVTVRCGSCDRDDQWPHPELGCPCGALVRVPVTVTSRPLRARERWESGPPGRSGTAVPEAGAGTGPDDDFGSGSDSGSGSGSGFGSGCSGADSGSGAGSSAGRLASGVGSGVGTGPGAGPGSGPGSRPGSGTRAGLPRPDDDPGPTVPLPRPAFHPVTIRTARDAVTAAALYLRWLGYRDIRRADQRPPSGIGLAARGVVAQVDPTVRPASPRDVECLWLTAMTESAGCVYFSLAGYDPEARSRADSLGIALFVLDLTGTPQPVNGPANELVTSGV
ncbi:hypothetical protein [Streptomyces poonensis]|uniref:Restriction endonuclease type IV Mrr domain-containing protein n=1 Tax=Streptomyces poonensis TaxID=68255 RepID=A0A918Q5H7_9ACTN|nr:hypothetical protein [Streptomyces poonensis]GGZ32724.1 hypothetical protein GCM10010365_61990 [Streptomyces poonensis]GLJ93142.1 hypothetical protein GCM10017589_57540 [Streptomyces poonensis]